jgi:hypothetical protein
MIRYVRAFFVALRMTIRGEKPKPAPDVPLIAWINRTPQLVAEIYDTAERKGLNRAAREKIVVRLDGRDMSMQTVLAAVEYHARQEYPYLLQNLTQHSVMAVYASNMNDQYHVMKLYDEQIVREPAVREAITRLSEHLNAIPAIKSRT